MTDPEYVSCHRLSGRNGAIISYSSIGGEEQEPGFMKDHQKTKGINRAPILLTIEFVGKIARR